MPFWNLIRNLNCYIIAMKRHINDVEKVYGLGINALIMHMKLHSMQNSQGFLVTSNVLLTVVIKRAKDHQFYSTGIDKEIKVLFPPIRYMINYKFISYDVFVY